MHLPLFPCHHQPFQSARPNRVVFASGGHDDHANPDKAGQQSDAGEKDDPKNPVNPTKTPDKTSHAITAENARAAIGELSRKKKISEEDAVKARKIMSEGSEEDRQKLLKFLQNATAGKLSQSEWKNFLAEAEKKPAQTPDEDKAAQRRDEADEDDLKFDIKKKITAQAGEAIATSKKLQAASEASKEAQNNEIPAKISHFKRDYENIARRSEENSRPVQDELKKMVKEGFISTELAYQLHQVDFQDENPHEQWEKLTRDIKDPKAKSALNHLLELKQREAEVDEALEREFQQKQREFRAMNFEIGNQVMLKANRERNLQTVSGAAGLPLKSGQVVVFDDLEVDKNGLLKNKKKKATIKEIRFDDIEIKDENGKVTKKIPSTTPTIVIESSDPETKKFTTNAMTPEDFYGWIDRQDVTEDLETQKDLELSLGQELKKGDKFEFREIINAADQMRSTTDTVVEIKNINPASKLIELDKKVLTRPGSGVRTDVLSFGQFARWFKSNEVMRPITSLEKLRTELRAHNEVLNSVYERNPAEYPAIEGKVGEVLFFEDNSGTDFVIKEIDDKKVVIDNHTPKGLTFTPAAFLRWVKKNEVEKRSPEAEALKTSRNLTGDEKKKVEDETRRKVEAQNQERREEQPPPDSPLGDEAANANDGHKKKQIYRLEERSSPSVSYLRRLWNGTTFASLSDLWEIGKKASEFIHHKWERRQKGVVGIIGERMFSWYLELGAEYKAHAQSAENEAVNHHVEMYRTMDVKFVKHELHETGNKDVLKAAITSLCEKGLMRWDDHAFWANIDKLSSNTPVSVQASLDYMDSLEKVIDNMWGKDTFRELRNKQDSSYNSIKNNFKDNGKRLENDPLQNGGLKAALQNLLYKHMTGEYVNPAEYESYLDFAIEAGKLTFGDKVFFLIMGVAAESPGEHGHHGSTLLHIDRVGAIESERLNNFPMLDFFTKATQDVDDQGRPLFEKNAKGEIIPRMVKPNIKHFRKWMREICQQDMPGKSFSPENMERHTYKDLKFGDHVTNYIEKRMLWDEATRQRMEKASPDVTRMDHDDMHYFTVMMSEELIEQLTKKAGGARQQMSNEGLKNAFAGLNHFINRKMKWMRQHLEEAQNTSLDKEERDAAAEAAKKDLRDILNIIRSFVRLDAIIDRRAYHGDTNFTRFSKQELDTPPVNDSSRTVRHHIQEVRLFLKNLAQEYHLEKEFDLLMDKSVVDNQQKEQQRMMMQFGNMLEGKMSRRKPEEILKNFEAIQEKNRVHGDEIQGIIERLENKSKADQIQQQRYTLTPYRLEEFNSKAKTIATYKKELADLEPKAVHPETVATERRERLTKILQQLEAGNYEFEEGDDDIMDKEIDRLRNQVTTVKGKFNTAYDQLFNQNQSANDNSQSQQAQGPQRRAA